MPKQSNHQPLQSTSYEETHIDDSRTHLDSQDSILDSTSQKSTESIQSTPQDSAKEAALESSLDSIESESAPKEERTIKIILGVGIALIFGIIAAIVARVYLGASFKVSALLGIIALLVTLWTNKALPLGVVSLLPIILSQALAYLIPKVPQKITLILLSISFWAALCSLPPQKK